MDAFNEKMVDFIESHNIPCPSCGKHNFTDIRQFNLMFKTFQGVTEDAKYRISSSETAQGIFVNFKMCRELPVRKFRLESDRLVSLSVMRLHRVTSHSVRESLSRWSWNFL